MFYLMIIYLSIMSMLIFLFSMLMVSEKIYLIMSWMMYKMLSYNLNYLMFFDWMTVNFMSVVMLITSMILFYSLEYMQMDLYKIRFMMLIMVFFLSMLMMIISPNLFSILLGWDGLGLSSYLLIIYYQSKKSMNCGLVTLLMNRIGDIMILMSISLLMLKKGLNFMFLKDLNQVMMIFMLIVVITKSAQVPFYIWLPMAMAAPTPVSALVHSSTLVTAGIYLFIRFSYLINSMIKYILMMISLFTLLVSSLSAFYEFDLKKIIALSTLSQLSLMFISLCLLKSNKFCYFHLVSHAMFKSLMFMCSGILIHSCFNNQDIRYMSHCLKNFPLVMMIFFTSSLSLMGFPFLSGFFSKDMIIENLEMQISNLMGMNIFVFSIFFTSVYSMRLLYYLCLKSSLKMNNFLIIKMVNGMMLKSTYLLYVLSIIFGSMMNWVINSGLNFVFMFKLMKILIFMLLLVGVIFSYMLFSSKINFMWLIMFKICLLFNSMWLMNLMIYNNMLLNMNNQFKMMKDLGWIEMIILKFNYYLLQKLMKLNMLIVIFLMYIIQMILLIYMIF